MMIKFLARGTGSAAAAADYLTRERNLAPEQDQDQDQDRDPEKNPEEVKVLRGGPHQVADVADALQFEHKCTSGVIAWAPEDNPSDAQIGRVVDEFEKTAWAGLEPDRYAWAAVKGSSLVRTHGQECRASRREDGRAQPANRRDVEWCRDAAGARSLFDWTLEAVRAWWAG